MKTSKVLSVNQVLNQTGDQKMWGDPAQGLNYDYIIKMEDGIEGIYSSKKQGSQDKFVVGIDTDYDYTPNTNPQWLGKIKPAKKEFTPGGKESDPKTRSSIERQTALKAAVEFNRERSAKTSTDVISDASTFFKWLSMEKPVDAIKVEHTHTEQAQPNIDNNSDLPF